jgi:branched-chain amino acid transport system permease protein
VETLIEVFARGMGTGSVYALLGLGFVIIYKGTDVVNFAQPGLMVLGGYAVSLFVLGMGFPFPVGVAAAMLATAAVGLITERIALRPMVGEPVFSAAMVTVGVFFIMLMIARRLMGPSILRSGDPWGLTSTNIGGVQLFHIDIAKLLITVAAFLIVGAFYKYSRAGLAMRATASDQEVALAQGVKVGRMFGLSWAISGALAALAGGLIATGGVGLQTETALVALKALPAIILGGLDSIRGAIIGGLAIGTIEIATKAYQPAMAPWLGSNFDQVMPYIVMLIVLMIRPYGLFGTPEVERV